MVSHRGNAEIVQSNDDLPVIFPDIFNPRESPIHMLV